MSHPSPHDDPENRYPSDDYKPVQRKHMMAKKMSSIDKLKKLIGESEQLRKYPLGHKNTKAKKVPHWFKSGPGGNPDLPPGYTDKDNE